MNERAENDQTNEGKAFNAAVQPFSDPTYRYHSNFYQVAVLKVENNLRDLFNDLRQKSPARQLIEAMNYSCSQPGKRLRPFLVYATGQLFNVNNLGLLDVCATSIELIHTYSLIHDDLPAMDNDAFRRGMPTCHKAFNEGTAILAGDALLTLAFELISRSSKIQPEQRINILRILAESIGPLGMLAGQELDLQGKNTEVLPDWHLINHLKTSLLFEASIKIALEAIVPNAMTHPSKHKLLEFIQHFGSAYQAYDDLEDAQGHPNDLQAKTLTCQRLFEKAQDCLQQIPNHRGSEFHHLNQHYLKLTHHWLDFLKTKVPSTEV